MPEQAWRSWRHYWLPANKKAPAKYYRQRLSVALENVEDKASADEAAQLINEAYREYKKEKIDMEQNQKRLRELREQISEKKYYNSEALRMVL